MNTIDLNLAVSLVKCITDNSRCACCDQIRSPCVRYPCGHYVCGDCVITAEDCSLCLTPPAISTHFDDNPTSLRVEHTLDLLNTFQDLFKLDVYRRQRISEQLKLEKELFPECIQAPSKYCNNRRSQNFGVKNKENIRPVLLAGENTLNFEATKMDTKINYVQQWLNTNEKSLAESKVNLPRKPFTNLSVNGQNNTRSKTPNKVIKKNKILSRKRKNADLKIKSKLQLKRTTINVACNEVQNKENSSGKQIKCEKNESGIVLDDDVFIINDSQTDSISKDKLAWLAVIEAEKKSPCKIAVESNYCNSDHKKDEMFEQLDKLSQNKLITYKVPFLKRSSLIELCNECNKSLNKHENLPNKNNNVTITIDSSSFITTITVLHCKDNNVEIKNINSVKVQTKDIMDCDSNVNSNEVINLPSIGVKTDTDSLKNYLQVKGNIEPDNNVVVPTKDCISQTCTSVRETKHLIIEDSDEDSYIFNEKDSLLEVTADIHRSETENDTSVLTQLKEGEYEHRIQHAVRGNTPVSTDSSDKENYDPNRAKRQKLEKKCDSKKYY